MVHLQDRFLNCLHKPLLYCIFTPVTDIDAGRQCGYVIGFYPLAAQIIYDLFATVRLLLARSTISPNEIITINRTKTLQTTE